MQKKIKLAYLQSALVLHIDALCNDPDADLVDAGEKFIALVHNAFNVHYAHHRFNMCKEEAECLGQISR